MVQYIKSDLEFILDQIRIAEDHVAAGSTRAALEALVGDTLQPLGVRTVSGAFNNITPGNTAYGSADQPFAHLVDPVYLPGYEPGSTVGSSGGWGGPNPPAAPTGDTAPRTISNLIADMTSNNPAATAAYEANIAAGGGATRTPATNLDGSLQLDADNQTVWLYEIPNISPAAGTAAPFNSWMTLFGQFFDHGLDSINKGGAGKVYIPLTQDDDLYDFGNDGIVSSDDGFGIDGVYGTADDSPNFMVLTRASLDAQGNTTNSTTPFIDQNQTYGSDASQQAYLRQYILVDDRVVATGKLIEGAGGGMATWADVKAQALNVLGITLSDTDVFDVPPLATDIYGNLLLDSNGHARLVTTGGLVSGIPGVGISTANALNSGHPFLMDINGAADPSHPGYDTALLNAHYIAGDGRANENIGLTAVHEVFHSEHNRLVDHTKAVVLATLTDGIDDGSPADLAFLNEWLSEPVDTIPANLDSLQWNGERLFQAAKFGTEMQYQHLVFEEFARKMQPALGEFASYDATIDPAITSEFANVVYRFGHSMLNETVDRYGADGTANHIGLIDAFLNPDAFEQNGTLTAEQAVGAIVRGMTRQAGNEIDEFVTDALRDNLLGLPLDLAALNIARGRDAGAPSLNAFRKSMYDQTGDTRLKDYISWEDFGQNLKHSASLVNFIAAYGTHASITSATTIEGMRAAAQALVTGTDEDSIAFMTATGGYAGGSLGGLNNVDFWMGGLAEKIEPFGGMLGSSFGFVFETQLESLQNHDRFYYLARLGGLHFLTEIENNSFSAMIVRNSDARHIALDAFATPEYTIELDQSKQFGTGFGPDGNGDPAFISRNNPSTLGPDTNYLKDNSSLHNVLGGTEGNDIIVGGGGMNSIWGDGGDDTIEGGYDDDRIEGGEGDDIITDAAGNDIIHGGAGDDVIQSGMGDDISTGGEGSDVFISIAGAAPADMFGGTGNDFYLGVPSVGAAGTGNEGDDWFQGGGGGVGDNGGAAAGVLADTVLGNDVFAGDNGDDLYFGEGGDGWCQTNANQSLFAQTRSALCCTELTPLGESGGAVHLEVFPAVEGALRVEQVVD